jgi:hypothetical protein
MHAILTTGFLALLTVPAFADNGRIKDFSSGRSYTAREVERDDKKDDRSDRLEVYGRDGQKTGNATRDSMGNVYSKETGRRIGVWRD